MRIFYMGALAEGQTSLQRLNVIRQMGHDVIAVDNTPVDRRSALAFLWYRIRLKLFRLGLDFMTAKDVGGCEQALAAAGSNEYDLLWMDKNWVIGKSVLADFRRRSPDTLVAGFSPDDMSMRISHSRQFLETLPLYDMFVTTKSYGVAELRALGCPEVYFVNNTYDEETHRPWFLTQDERQSLGGRVGFIGMYEPERADSLRYLGERGIPIRIWGPFWHRFRKPPSSIRLELRPVWGGDYAKAISSFDINLAFLSKQNRDQQTTRSVEIPACGGFMLAERTEEHKELFKEGVEADFFSSKEELLEKVRYYLDHEEVRRRIAQAGRERCLAAGYGSRRSMETIFSKLQQKAQRRC